MEILNFKQWLIEDNREKIFDSEDEFYDYHESMIEIEDGIKNDIINQIENYNQGDTIDWNVIPAGRAKKIWKDYGSLGIVRDTTGINQIKDIMIDNTIKLNLTNAILGHDRYYPQDEWKDEFFDGENERYELFRTKLSDAIENDFFTYNRQDLISDFGLPQLLKEVPNLYKTKDNIEILRVVDRMLNVAHQRNDLSAFFIEGGSRTLNDMSN